VLFALLTFETLLPGLGVTSAALVHAGALVAVLVVLAGTVGWRSGRTSERISFWSRASWTMPPLETLAPPTGSRGREIGLVVLRAYLTLAAVALVATTVRSTLAR
jgi:hypothetical protein